MDVSTYRLQSMGPLRLGAGRRVCDAVRPLLPGLPGLPARLLLGGVRDHTPTSVERCRDLSTLAAPKRGIAMAIRTSSVGEIASREEVSLDEFRRLDLRVGEIIAAQPILGSDRLIAVTVDLDVERRTLVAGVGKAYSTDELKGLRVVVAANLVPATIRGVESQGMLLGVGCDDPAGVALVTVNRAVANGAMVV